MIAQFTFSILLAGIVIYAWSEYARSPVVAVLTLLVASAGLYFVWMPAHATATGKHSIKCLLPDRARRV